MALAIFSKAYGTSVNTPTTVVRTVSDFKPNSDTQGLPQVKLHAEVYLFSISSVEVYSYIVNIPSLTSRP